MLTANRSSDIRHLAGSLRRHGYASAAVPQTLGSQLGKFHFRSDLPLYLRRLAASTPINVLVKLFVLEHAVAAAEFAGVLPELDVDVLAALGIAERRGDSVHPLVRISAYCDLLLAHDRMHGAGAAPADDHVLGIGAGTVTLDCLTVRSHVRRALDLGTGCGVQALLAARHCEHVVAVDKNPRAVDFARFNAELNGIENVSVREGSFFEPVEDEQFDLIVSNPPYVISPESRFIFRDAGEPADRACERLVQSVPSHLVPGGYASVLCNWVVSSYERRDERPREWAVAAGCDALLLTSDVQDSLTYAALWNRDDRDEYGERLDRWQEYFSSAGIPAIGMGTLIMRRRSDGGGWMRSVDLDAKPAESCSDQILAVFAGNDALARLDERALLQQNAALAGEHRCVQQVVWRGGQCTVDDTRLELKKGLGLGLPIDLGTLQFLGHLSRGGTIAEAMASFAAAIGERPEAVHESLVSIVRSLLALGFLRITRRTGGVDDERIARFD